MRKKRYLQYKPSYIHSISALDFFILIILTRLNLKKGDPRLLHDVIVAGASALIKKNSLYNNNRKGYGA